MALLSLHTIPNRAETIAAWQKVDTCEAKATGGWRSFSWNYPDGLGIDRTNWIMFGGKTNKPSKIWTQISVGIKFIKYYHISIPDQHGCYAY